MDKCGVTFHWILRFVVETMDSLSKLNIEVEYILVLAAEVEMPVGNNLIYWIGPRF